MGYPEHKSESLRQLELVHGKCKSEGLTTKTALSSRRLGLAASGTVAGKMAEHAANCIETCVDGSPIRAGSSKGILQPQLQRACPYMFRIYNLCSLTGPET